MSVPAPLRVVGIRGATTVDRDSLEEILEATQDLLERLRALNDIDPDDIASIVFSTTRDLTSTFPARAARRLGWVQVPMLCTHEVDAPNAVPRCIRVLIHWNTTRSTREVRHAYLRDSRLLRPDWAWPPLAGPAGAVTAPEDPVREAALAAGAPTAPAQPVPTSPATHAIAPGSLVPIAFQGEPGAWSEAAIVGLAVALGMPRPATVPSQTFAAAIDNVVAGRARAALLPVENSTTGSIQEVWDLLATAPLEAVAEVVLPVRHALVATPDATLASIRTVVSHPQALAQCARWIAGHGWRPEAGADTAGSARLLAEQPSPDRAAIASPLAAAIHGLVVLAADIQDVADNFTRFLLLVPAADNTPRLDVAAGILGSPKTSLVFATRHAPGTLYACLAEFAVRDISLTRIESRPDRRTPWNYLFYVDIEGDPADPRVASALVALERHTAFLRILGVTPSLHLKSS
jgi:monofunctional chorismate mutase